MSVNLGWRDVPFADRLESLVGVSAVVDHNVRAMALAEARYGQARGYESVAFVYVRTGVGAGLVMNGQPYRGGTHGATELGHVRVTAENRRCACGSHGCLETVASEAYLAERARTAGFRGRAGRTATDRLLAAARDKDRAALEILTEVANYLGTGLSNLVNLLNPQLIVLGGLCVDAGEELLTPLRSTLREQTFPLVRDVTEVTVTSFGQQAGVIGAAAVALDEFFYSSTVSMPTERSAS